MFILEQKIIGRRVWMQPKKSFSKVDYQRCQPKECDPDQGICKASKACTHKVMKQIDGAFEPPIVFQDLCMACWDCIEACPLKAVERMEVT
jgi:translation initiation factor RLI1